MRKYGSTEFNNGEHRSSTRGCLSNLDLSLSPPLAAPWNAGRRARARIYRFITHRVRKEERKSELGEFRRSSSSSLTR